MKEIDKKMAHRLFTNALITEAVFSSKRFYEDDLIIERLNKVLLIPWNDWALFNFIKKTDQLTIDKQLHAKSLDEICSKFYSAADEDSHTERIKKIEELIGKYGYVNRSPCCFAIFETGKEMDLYLIDGHHRLIAYKNRLNKNSTAYTNVKFVLGEVDSIEVIVGRFNWIR